MLDTTKPLQTKDGRKVSLVATEGRGDYPLIGYVGDDTIPRAWTKEGEWYGDYSDLDLINTPEDIYVWVNVYKDSEGKLILGGTWHSRERADAVQDDERVGRIRVKLVEDQWDE